MRMFRRWREGVFLSAVMLAHVAAPSQERSAQPTPPNPALHAINLLPAPLRHNRPAKDAAEQKSWDEAIFRYYRQTETAGNTSDRKRPVLDTRAKHNYRTRLRWMSREKPTFAGNAVAEDIGCGTSCFSVGVVVLNTGQTYLLENLGSANVFVRADYRLDSRIMHVMGFLGRQHAAERWYLLEPHALRLMFLQPMSDDCFDVGNLEALWSSATCKFVANTAEPEPLIH